MNTPIIGLHEIHITVQPDQVALLRFFCVQNKMKPILATALYGDHPNQLMISKYSKGTSGEVIKKAHNIADKMREFGLTPIRVKVEAMIHCKGAPRGDEKPYKRDDYWEFHIKVEINNMEELALLSETAKEHDAHISFNAFKKETIPLVTLRLYECSYNEAIKQKDILLDHIKEVGFPLHHGIHHELSVYDNNQKLDKGWLPYPF